MKLGFGNLLSYKIVCLEKEKGLGKIPKPLSC
jgi:hypothetical protein